jgi:hypothetical protein
MYLVFCPAVHQAVAQVFLQVPHQQQFRVFLLVQFQVSCLLPLPQLSRHSPLVKNPVHYRVSVPVLHQVPVQVVLLRQAPVCRRVNSLAQLLLLFQVPFPPHCLRKDQVPHQVLLQVHLLAHCLVQCQVLSPAQSQLLDQVLCQVQDPAFHLLQCLLPCQVMDQVQLQVTPQAQNLLPSQLKLQVHSLQWNPVLVQVLSLVQCLVQCQAPFQLKGQADRLARYQVQNPVPNQQ